MANTEMTEIEMNAEKSAYRRHCFDRFGDDLCESILSRLAFDEKIELECVSKQWRRCLFDGQTELVIEFDKLGTIRQLDFHRKQLLFQQKLANLLQKCAAVRRLSVDTAYYFDGLLDIIAVNCPHLDDIALNLRYRFSISEESLLRFGQKCGARLRRVMFSGFHSTQFEVESGSDLNAFLANCPNIETIIEDQYCLSIANQQHFHRLTSFAAILSREDDLKLWSLFVDRYGRQIRSIKLSVLYRAEFSGLELSILLLRKFKNLETLELNVHDDDSKIRCSLDAALRAVAESCPQLNQLKVKLESTQASSFYVTNVCDTFGCFRALRSLAFDTTQDSVEFGALRSLASVSDLRHLTIKFKGLSDRHLIGVHEHCSQLRSIKLASEQNLSDKILLELARLSCLLKVRIVGPKVQNRGISQTGIGELINGCPNLRELHFGFKLELTSLAMQALVDRAQRWPKVKLNFSFFQADNGRILMTNLRIPENLSIKQLIF